MDPQRDRKPPTEDVDHAEVSRREQVTNQPVGPRSGVGRPVTIAGIVVVAFAILWAVFYSNLFF